MVKVRFFASFREQVGREEVNLEFDQKITIAELLEKLKNELPEAEKILESGRCIIAVNQEVAKGETPVSPGDEVAIFPPVSGGCGDKEERPVRVQRDDFSVGAEIDGMRRRHPRAGAVVAFLGTVREFSRGKTIRKLQYEHYPGMAEKKLLELREDALKKFGVLDVRIIHRVGELRVNDNIVLIVVSSEHRADAFDACRWCIDELKKKVPIWKKEVATTGEEWIEEHP
jgi:molybdopterin synthase catalytic subunit